MKSHVTALIAAGIVTAVGCATPTVPDDAAMDVVTGDAVDTAEGPLTTVECLRSADCTRLMVAAHRGAHLSAPENSLAALRAAAELGADFVEIDVRNTIDNKLVVTHDDSVATTTNGTGKVSAMPLDQVRALTLQGATDDPETQKIPLFSEVLELAYELGVMLYLDAKTDQYRLVVDEIAGNPDGGVGPYYDVVLYREEWDVARLVAQADPLVMIMPPVPVESAGNAVADAQTMLAAVPGLKIVEFAWGDADATVYAGLKGLGLKIQQDVMAGGDVLANWGDYTGYKSYADAGITLMQTDYPHILVPAVEQFNTTGNFPASGPMP